MYFGESNTSVDDKGRVNLPVQFRQIMDALDQDTWYMTRGFDGAIFLFTPEKWGKLLSETQGHSTLDPQMLDFRRFFLGSLAKVKRDGQGRLPVPGPLREYAGIGRDAVLIGVEDHLELWSKENWRAFQSRQADQYKAMAAELFGRTNGGAAATAGVVQGA
jgi:MraZ protein